MKINGVMMNDSVDVVKAESNINSTDVLRMRLGEVGKPYLKSAGSWIINEERRELQHPYALKTYEKMRQCATVDAALSTAEVFLTKAIVGGKFKTTSTNPKAKEFCNFLNWNLKNLADTTWYDSVTNIISYLQYGFSWLEKVYEKNPSPTYKQFKYKLKKLAPRSQHSINEWQWSDDQRSVVAIRQYPNPILNTLWNPQMVNVAEYPVIKRNKIMLFSYNSLNNNPLGRSPLNAVYRAWKEKTLCEAYEMGAVAKAAGGLIVVRLPTEHINQAQEDPTSEAAQTLKSLTDQCALIHSGDQTYILLGSDVQGEAGNGKYVYDIDIKGVESSGNVVNMSDIIDSRKKAILDAFAAGFINLGNEGGGSYSLADSKVSIHAFYMERHIMFIQSVIQNDLVKQLMEINDLFLPEDDIPVFQPAKLDDVDPEAYSKMAQRMGAVGYLPKTKEIIIDILNKCGVDTDSLVNLTQEELVVLLPESTSRSGDGMESGMPSGTGNSNGNNSATNSDNKA